MKQLFIAALALVAGSCSLIKVGIKPAYKPPTPAQASQIVLTDPATFQQVGQEWTRLHPCMIQQQPDGKLTLFYGGGRPVSLPIAGLPVQTGTITSALPRDAGDESPAMGGSPLMDVDVNALQDAQDTADVWRQRYARETGKISTLEAEKASLLKWVHWLAAIDLLLVAGLVLAAIHLLKKV
jgi:hypothetical protein